MNAKNVEVEDSGILGYEPLYLGNSLPTFRDHFALLGFGDRGTTIPRNFGNHPPS
jgi:hypothetical protein